ncbi:hypothetical protein BMS3Abin04_00338 [bacterium BMS3Abin04]|nr:hypothetical protein BMS3Abin04_00338 [bacterium BMS3Abin04]
MKTFYALCLVLFNSILFAQSGFGYNGYLENLQTVWAPKEINQWVFSNSISNRINFSWYASDAVTFNASLRSIFDYGQFVQIIPGYADIVSKDNGYFNLTKKIASDKSYVLYSNIDRLNLIYSKNNIEVQLGRQRINLGKNLVWTPNDIFNASSFLNFDYVEKPGSDAVRIQYYTGIASSIQFAYKLNSNNKATAAGIIKINQWDYDFQFLGGIMEDDYILGFGWSGQISSAGFSGEITYFRNKDNQVYNRNILVAALSGNYTFSNSLFIHGEFLYNSAGKTKNAGRFNNIFTLQYSAKNLSPAKYSAFSEISYPITPLITASTSSIFNPSDKSFYIGPSVEFSLTSNIYLLVAGQFFIGDKDTEWGNFGKFYFLRLKWNF